MTRRTINNRLVRSAAVFGLIGKRPEGANALAFIFHLILPFTSSAFVRPASMPAGLRLFAEYQPFTPVIDKVRGLLGTPIGNSAALAVAWCVGLLARTQIRHTFATHPPQLAHRPATVCSYDMSVPGE